MESRFTRRSILGVCGGALLGTARGVASLTRGQQTTGDDIWRQYQFNAAKTGANAQASAPTASHVRAKWTYDADWEFTTQPVLAGGRVYAGTVDGILYAVNAIDGTIEWNYPVRKTESVLTPAVYGGHVFVSKFNSLLALDATNGAKQWEVDPEGGGHFTEPVAATQHRVYVTTEGGGNGRDLYAYSHDGGEQLHVTLDDTATFFWYTPTIADGRMYLTADGGAGDGKFEVRDTTYGEVRWSRTLTGMSPTGPAIVGNQHVYLVGDNGEVRAYDPTEQREVKRLRFTLNEGIDSTGAFADGTLYVLAGQDPSTLYALDMEAGVQKWSRSIGDGGGDVVPPPVVANETVYVSLGATTAYDTSGNKRWKFDEGDTVNVPVTPGNGLLYVGSDSRLLALEEDIRDTPTSTPTPTESPTPTATESPTPTETSPPAATRSPTSTESSSPTESSPQSSPATPTATPTETSSPTTKGETEAAPTPTPRVVTKTVLKTRQETEAETPGFGYLHALVALGAGAGYLWKRNDDANDE